MNPINYLLECFIYFEQMFRIDYIFCRKRNYKYKQQLDEEEILF